MTYETIMPCTGLSTNVILHICRDAAWNGCVEQIDDAMNGSARITAHYFQQDLPIILEFCSAPILILSPLLHPCHLPWALDVCSQATTPDRNTATPSAVRALRQLLATCRSQQL